VFYKRSQSWKRCANVDSAKCVEECTWHCFDSFGSSGFVDISQEWYWSYYSTVKQKETKKEARFIFIKYVLYIYIDYLMEVSYH
jgi:hypothetical protein